MKYPRSVLCIDPGTTHSGMVIIDYNNVKEMPEIIEAQSSIKNEDLIDRIEQGEFDIYVDHMAIEMVASYGMAVGKTTFETVLWIGRFIQAFRTGGSTKVYRKDVKVHLCRSMRAKDANVRQAILDLYPATGGGKTPQIGTKKQPGPLYGVKSHAISALAIGLTFLFDEEYCDFKKG